MSSLFVRVFVIRYIEMNQKNRIIIIKQQIQSVNHIINQTNKYNSIQLVLSLLAELIISSLIHQSLQLIRIRQLFSNYHHIQITSSFMNHPFSIGDSFTREGVSERV